MRPDLPDHYRLAIRPYRASDDPTLEAWFPEAQTAAFGSSFAPSCSWREFKETWLEATPAGRLNVFFVGGDAAPVGIALWHYGTSGRADAIVCLLALAKPNRGWGLGTEAAYLLEKEILAARTFVQIPASNGLSVYFWLRLGYHPLLKAQQELPLLQEGGMWMVRPAAQALAKRLPA
jgi:hypothetical protein